MPLVANGDDQGGATAAVGRRGTCGRSEGGRHGVVITSSRHRLIRCGMVCHESFLYGSVLNAKEFYLDYLGLAACVDMWRKNQTIYSPIS
jgi:hypothetical protein